MGSLTLRPPGNAGPDLHPHRPAPFPVSSSSCSPSPGPWPLPSPEPGPTGGVVGPETRAYVEAHTVPACYLHAISQVIKPLQDMLHPPAHRLLPQGPPELGPGLGRDCSLGHLAPPIPASALPGPSAARKLVMLANHSGSSGHIPGPSHRILGLPQASSGPGPLLSSPKAALPPRMEGLP